MKEEKKEKKRRGSIVVAFTFEVKIEKEGWGGE